RHQLLEHAGGARAFNHRRTIGIELRRVEMAVAVEQHAAHCFELGSTSIGGRSDCGRGSASGFWKLDSSSAPRPSRISSMKGMKSGTTRSSRNRPMVILN